MIMVSITTTILQDEGQDAGTLSINYKPHAEYYFHAIHNNSTLLTIRLILIHALLFLAIADTLGRIITRDALPLNSHCQAMALLYHLYYFDALYYFIVLILYF